MKALQYCFLLLVCFGGALYAEDEVQTTVELTQGYRHDRFDMRFRGQESTKFKTLFKDVDIYSSRLVVTAAKNDFFLKGVVGYGDVLDGDFRHTMKYHSANRNVYFKKYADVSGNYTQDYSLHFGKTFYTNNGWKIAPVIGYGVYKQKFTTKHAKFSHHDHGIYTLRSKGKGSLVSQKATWYSPQVGLYVEKDVIAKLKFLAGYNFLFPLNYQGKTSWNKSSKDEEENKAYRSYGHIFNVGLQWNFLSNWALKPEFEYSKLHAEKGDLGHRYRLKSVKRAMYEARLGLLYSF